MKPLAFKSNTYEYFGMTISVPGLQKMCFLITLLGIASSLYFSDVMGFEPCILCWYQRILFYPLILIYSVALWTNDLKHSKYVWPFLVLGILVSTYHNLLYFGIVSESISPCTEGASCSAKQLELFGFLTIPLMSLAGFIGISVLELTAVFTRRRIA